MAVPQAKQLLATTISKHSRNTSKDQQRSAAADVAARRRFLSTMELSVVLFLHGDTNSLFQFKGGVGANAFFTSILEFEVSPPIADCCG